MRALGENGKLMIMINKTKLFNRIEQLIQWLRWFGQGKMERWQVEDLFNTILDEIDPEVDLERIKDIEQDLASKEEASWEVDEDD